ncbi:hypothetical protein [Brevundimonas sp.]|uniref:hypothetical protein n=1 Tax=Brevundimonas sp. TaxID=1871086 RepID=UPI0035B265D2
MNASQDRLVEMGHRMIADWRRRIGVIDDGNVKYYEHTDAGKSDITQAERQKLVDAIELWEALINRHEHGERP